jgi:hypothetical protein
MFEFQDDPIPAVNEDEEMDVIAFELWQRSCRKDAAAAEDCSDDEEAVGCHASCL